MKHLKSGTPWQMSLSHIDSRGDEGLMVSENVCKELQLKIMLNPPDEVVIVFIAFKVNYPVKGVYECTCTTCSGNWKRRLRIKFGGSEDYQEYHIGRNLADNIRGRFIL